MSADVHLGDIGTQFLATVRDQDGVIVDISTATTKQLLFKKPDGTVVAKTATLVTTGADGQMAYVTIANDLDLAGAWQVQGYVVLPTGTWHTDVRRFMVDANLQ